MMTIYIKAETLAKQVNEVKLNSKRMNTEERAKRLDRLSRMFLHVEPEQMIAVDEELFEFLEW